MRVLHWINCGLWIANSVVWAGVAQSVTMTLVSAGAAFVAGWIAIKTDPYY
jgi:hypothetical protein